MKKKYLAALLFFSLISTASFSQAPFANSMYYIVDIDCISSNNNYEFTNFLQGAVSQNGININSVDLNINESGIQSNYSGAVQLNYVNNTLYVTASSSLVGTFPFSYTFTDNLGNISNVGTININCYGGNLSDYVSINSVTCDVQNGQITFDYIGVERPITLKLYRHSNITLELYSTSTITTYNPFQISNLPYGYYEYTVTSSCGVEVISGGGGTSNGLPRRIQMINPLSGNATANYVDFNNNGVVDVGDTLNYVYTITNNSTSCTMHNVRLDSFWNGQSIPSIAPNATDSSMTYTKILNQYDINLGDFSIFPKIHSDEVFSNGYSFFTTSQINLTTNLGISSGIKLVAFIDANNNGIRDASETYYTNGTFNYRINSGDIHNLNTNLGELYLYETNPANVYTIGFNISQNNNYCGSQYIVPTTSYTNLTVPSTSGIITYNFPITLVPCSDLKVDLVNYWTQPIPGFQYKNRIKFANTGNQYIPSQTITFTKDPNVTIVDISNNGTIATPTGFTYTFSNLYPSQTGSIDVTLQIPQIPTIALGQQLTNSVQIAPTDLNPNDNSANLTETIIGAYDPNDKTEVHGGQILHSTFTPNDYLTYTIRFENTGTANAINIRVNDLLDLKLDENTIRMVDASHSYILDRVGTVLNWRFNGINLPPSNGNPTIGHGYITFQIKPKTGYAIGDIIPNTANIYFDFNPAITTPVCNTEFVAALNTNNYAFTEFKYYPNPIKNSLFISNNSEIDAVEITSVLGQKMMHKEINALQVEVYLSEFSNGIYFVKISSGGQEKIIKIIKE